ncbi:hypothetical protein WDZ92_07210 [Nostoc sp. NIES-2111]
MTRLTNEEVADLLRLQKLLREQQRALVLAAAKGTALPPRRAIQEIAELESAIVATDAVLQDG